MVSGFDFDDLRRVPFDPPLTLEAAQQLDDKDRDVRAPAPSSPTSTTASPSLAKQIGSKRLAQ